jgi:hypothetical protein
MIIDNSKFIITNEVIDDLFDLRIMGDLTGTPSVLKIEKQNVGIVYFCKYDILSFFTTDTTLVITGPQFYGEFSANNYAGFTTPIALLQELLTDITTS